MLKGVKVAIIGYGSQGHAQAQNLRDSGVDVIVAELEGTANYKIAQDHGFKPVSAVKASKDAAVIQILAQDNLQAKLYNEEIKQNLKKGKTLVFSTGSTSTTARSFPRGRGRDHGGAERPGTPRKKGV